MTSLGEEEADETRVDGMPREVGWCRGVLSARAAEGGGTGPDATSTLAGTSSSPSTAALIFPCPAAITTCPSSSSMTSSTLISTSVRSPAPEQRSSGMTPISSSLPSSDSGVGLFRRR